MIEKTRMDVLNGLQQCKEASWATTSDQHYCSNPSQDVAKVIGSLDEELSHDKLIEEIMCAFSGIPSTAVAIDETILYMPVTWPELANLHQQI